MGPSYTGVLYENLFNFLTSRVFTQHYFCTFIVQRMCYTGVFDSKENYSIEKSHCMYAFYRVQNIVLVYTVDECMRTLVALL